MFYILGKIQIISCKCTSNVVLLLITALCQLLELRNNQIIASFSVTERAHLVIHFFSSVKTDDNVVHLFVHELLNFIVQKNSVCCQCETEMLVMKFLLLSSVSNQVFDNLPVHQRLTTEEVNLKVSSCS